MDVLSITLSRTTLIAMASIIMASRLAAQETTSDMSLAKNSINPLEEVRVEGIRHSLEKATTVKRNSTQFIDAIVSEDIGKLPDINAAESLQRVSGVQLDRGIGEGSAVSIRGLRANVTLANGREIFDASGRLGKGPDTLGTSSNSLLTLIPAELIARLEVTKHSGADEIEGAIGGTVNVVTRKPLDIVGARGAGSLSITEGELSEKAKPKVAFYVSDTFADDTVGVLL